jgi:hypothetical protein
MPFEKGNTHGFSKDKQPDPSVVGRKKNPLTEILKKVLDEKVDIEVEKGKGKVKMTRGELMLRGVIQKVTQKGDAALFLSIMDRVDGPIKMKLELSEKNPLGGAMGDLSRMTMEQQIAARPDLFRMLLEKADAMRVKVEDAEIVTEETPILSIESPKILE